MKNNIKHHLATAVGFIFLIAWYVVLDFVGFFDLSRTLFSEQYQGSGLMLGIGLGMTPAFFIWSRYTKWVERKLNIKGIYIEDSYYAKDKKEEQTKNK